MERDPSQFDPDQIGAPASPAAAPPPAADQAPQPSPEVSGAPESTEQIAPQQPGESSEDYRTRWEEADARASRLQGTLDQVGQWAQQRQEQEQRQAVQSEFERRRTAIWDTAQQMDAESGFRYAQQQEAILHQQRDQAMGQLEQYYRGEIQRTAEVIAAPQWARELATRNGLPAEYAEDLAALGDGRAMERAIPRMKREWTKTQALQQQITQLSRSQAADERRTAGVGLVAGMGAAPPGDDLPTDPDQKALALLRRSRGMPAARAS